MSIVDTLPISCPSKYTKNLLKFDKSILSHGKRTAEYAVAFTNKSGILIDKYAQAEKLDVLQAIYDAGYLHDLGKVMYAKSVLYSNRKLSDSEKKIMEQHPIRTLEIIKSIEDFSAQSKVYQSIVKNACLYHHEKWDGSGYPFGLCKKDIPVEASIISIADILDALTSNRSYKQAWSFEEAINHLYKTLMEEQADKLLHSFQYVYDELKIIYITNNSSCN